MNSRNGANSSTNPALLTDDLKDVCKFDEVVRFINLARHLKSEIQALAREELYEPPPWLPETVTNFFISSLEIDEEVMMAWWSEFKEIIWHGELRPLTDFEEGLLQKYGPRASITKHGCFSKC